jgi:hypothetical protein
LLVGADSLLIITDWNALPPFRPYNWRDKNTKRLQKFTTAKNFNFYKNKNNAKAIEHELELDLNL